MCFLKCFQPKGWGLCIFFLTVLVFSSFVGLSSTANAAESVLINTITRTGGSTGDFTGLGMSFSGAAFKFTPDYQYSLSAFEMNYCCGAVGWTIRDGLNGAILESANAQITGVSGLPRWEFVTPVLLNPGTAYYLVSGKFAGNSLQRMSGNGNHFALGSQVYGLAYSIGWIPIGSPANYVSGGGDITFYGELLTKVFIDALRMADPETGSFLHEGATVSGNDIKFEAVASTTLGASVKIQVEVRKSYAPFTGVFDGNIYESIFTSSPGSLSVVIPFLPNGEYHARLRAVDDLGNASDWREFGAAGSTDFTINFVSNTISTLINTFNPSSGSRGSFTGLGYSVGAAAYAFTPDENYMLTRFEMDYFDSGLNWNIRSGLSGEIMATSSKTIPMPNIRKKWEFFGGVNLKSGTTYYLQTADSFNAAALLRISGSGTAWTPGGIVYGRSDYNMLWNTFGNPIEPQNFLAGAGNGATVDFYGFSVSVIAKNPVIVVPGILGSRLNRVSDGEEVWPDGNTMFLSSLDSQLDELILFLDGSQNIGYNMNPSEVILNERILLLANKILYKNLIDSLVDQKYVLNDTLITFPYDWRLDIQDEAQKLGDTIAAARANSPTGKVDIIAHSMGGLLVKQYLLQATGTNFIDKLIFVGVPNLGAPKALKILNYGDDLGFTFSNQSVLNPDEVKKISQNMPAIYELLPSRKYLDKAQFNSYVWDFRSVFGNGKILNYNDTSNFLAAEGRNPILLSMADAFHEQSDNAVMALSPSAKFYTLLGCEAPSPTISGFNIFDNDRFGIRYSDGDGTVPLLSSDSFSEATNKYYVRGKITGADHLGLVSSTSTLELIQNLLGDNPDISLNGISQNPTDCKDQTQLLLIATHSPVKLHVYDDQGRHLGPNQNGDVEFNIPDSGYDIIEHNSFAIVPAGVNYRIVLEATDAGKFDLDVSSLTDFQVQNKITYLNIPLQSANATASLSFVNFNNPPVLNLDNDGDGTADKIIQPTAVLDASSSQDITPPIIIMPTLSSEIIKETTTTFIFGADDLESGVATTSATLNGMPITSGQTVIFTNLGQNIFHFEAKDFAGNPRVREIKFNVIYNFGSFLQPIKLDGLGVYNQGRTLPVKFKLQDADGMFISNVVANLFLTKIADSIISAEDAALSTSKADTGNQFRYDAASNQYIFNLATNSLSLGTWQLKILLDDGKNYSVNISIK